MKVIEAMKKIQELQIKAEDLRQKVRNQCADLDFETPMYPDQRQKIREWMQAHEDIMKEILSLRTAIQRTNLATKATMELGSKQVEKTVAEWIHRRRDLAKLDFDMWSGLTDRGLKAKEGRFQPSVPGAEPKEVKIRLYFDPEERDKKIDLYRSEPGIIDRTLEVVNAVTDLVE